MTPWWLVPIAYVPIMIWFYTKFWENNTFLNLVFIPVGMLTWSMVEYSLHRFFFHMEDQMYFPKFSWFYSIHFLVHGIHHAFPNDAYRILFPPILGYPIFLSLVKPVMHIVYPAWAVYPVCFGIGIAYVIYDQLHYYFHHASPEAGTYLQ